MSPESLYAALVPELDEQSAPSAPDSKRRSVRWRAPIVLALLSLLLLPLPGSIHASSAADIAAARPTLDATPGTSRAARTPKVFMKLERNRVTTGQRARVKVALSVRGTRSAAGRAAQQRSLGSGWVKVVAKAGGKSRPMRARLVAGKAAVALPRLPADVYRVRAVFLGLSLIHI